MWMISAFSPFFKIAPAIHDDAAGDGTIGAGVPGFSGLGELERPHMRGDHRLRFAVKPNAPNADPATPVPAIFMK